MFPLIGLERNYSKMLLHPLPTSHPHSPQAPDTGSTPSQGR